ncbi:HNH endonuclease [Pseudomonas sp. CG7]|uniref:HNH endonuclease signature motif containing protein n=1 Tax=Pseudomonas sp. CG7 TaxID=191007 RepID=UPI00203443CF|nr:HNH endonuclease signature motif containing protein [Pseudomonas sp. CG7]MCM2461035.1 HNH endonuclease [Pseudomonas sp. CG7]
MTSRPPIPPEMKREVRQRCGFGCVICGLPIYEYEHMLEWAEVKRHVAEEITLLCRQHHGEKTNKLLPKEAVIAANLDPYNKRSGVSKNYMLHYSGSDVKVSMGGSTFSYQNVREDYVFAPIVIDSWAIMAFRREMGNLLLSFTAFNESNAPIVSIVDNEIEYDTSLWDAEWVGQSLVIREEHRKILLKVIFNPPGEIIIAKGRILRNGLELLVGENYIFISNNSTFASPMRTDNCQVGLALGDPRPQYGAGISITNIPRYGFDRKKSRQFLRECLVKCRKEN